MSVKFLTFLLELQRETMSYQVDAELEYCTSRREQKMKKDLLWENAPVANVRQKLR